MIKDRAIKIGQSSSMLGIYIHIPFCIQKCHYCDFLSAPATGAVREAYLQALLAEIAAQSQYYKKREVNTVFLGGGTPSVLTEEQTRRILETLGAHFRLSRRAEITSEVNPGTVTMEKLKAYRSMGINRLSIGLQSADDRELKILGRIHTAAEFDDCFHMAREAGFANINVDVMSALPGQSAASYEKTLQYVRGLAPEHISAYSLIIEEGTPFAQRYAPGAPSCAELPDEETDRLMYHRTGQLLAECGYKRYEISNYARDGFACRHNEAYWKRTDYAGFGLGAASMVDNVRWSNEPDLNAYLAAMEEGEDVRREIQELTEREQMEEFFFLGLRRMEGVSCLSFAKLFHREPEEIYGPVLDRLREEGLLLEKLTHDDRRYCLTKRGIDVSNSVFYRFLQD